jgi:hypothetical protein
MVEVVNMRKCDPPWGQPGDVRIDRATKWGNPYPITDTDSRDAVLFKYTWYIVNAMENKELNITELTDARRLGCWCKPKACHGDILKKAIEQYNDNQQKRLV